MPDYTNVWILQIYDCFIVFWKSWDMATYVIED